MRKILVWGTAVWAGVSPAMAERPYDRKLEKAVMEIVAARIGDIRGGFSYAQVPQFVVVQVLPSQAARAMPAPDVAGGGAGLRLSFEGR